MGAFDEIVLVVAHWIDPFHCLCTPLVPVTELERIPAKHLGHFVQRRSFLEAVQLSLEQIHRHETNGATTQRL